MVSGIRDCDSPSVECSVGRSSSKTKLTAIRNAQESPFQILQSDTPSPQLGIQKLTVPEDNAQEAAVVPDLDVYGVKAITDVVDFLNNPVEQAPISIDGCEALASARPHAVDLRDVKGQAQARRALEIAAAGEHNLFLS